MDDARRVGAPSSGARCAADPRQDRAGLNEQTQRRIGNHLRSMYDAVLQQPVPDRFRDLIARLDASEPDQA
ncbi:NepR family anti-sigma factor [Methylobacterium durans]|uniref:Anti-sigma factor n=1 Tax=Methylobacterium durans TaxID=2202825 RepID=A0A2U8WF60_9HYPH|nr:NepR family anti-sigma factor [Methylobacterium durans]AWN44178.1 anti-sigma factor [Methylobacterium durans]